MEFEFGLQDRGRGVEKCCEVARGRSAAQHRRGYRLDGEVEADGVQSGEKAVEWQ